MAESAITGQPELRGLVLAGGLSRRMGRDKAGLEFDGSSQLARAVSLLQEFLPDVRVSVRADQEQDRSRRGYPLIIDQHDDIGPAAGILAANALFPNAAWLVLACDMPLLSRAVISELIGRRDPAKAATAYRNLLDGLPEPLCAIYEPGTLARFRPLAEARSQTSPRALLADSDVQLLALADATALENINTPEDVSRINDLLTRLRQ